jgi:hypothetical protein
MDQAALTPEDDDPDNLVVYVNAMNPEDISEDGEDRGPLFSAAVDAYYFLRKHELKSRLVKINAISRADLDAKLKKIRKELEKPISRVEIYGHGFNDGRFDVRDEWVDGEHWTREKGPGMTGVFKPGAKMFFYSCWGGRGTDAEKVVQRMGRHYFDEGGEVYMSKMTVVGSPNLLGDILLAPYIALKGYEEKSLFLPTGDPEYRYGEDKITKFVIPPRPKVPVPLQLTPQKPEEPKRLIPNAPFTAVVR